jgi:GPH family glycoside/pentoside/hexuronide:cation symporter
MARQKPDRKLGWQTTRGERLSYGLYFVGQNIFYMLVSSFTALFLLNRGLSETVIAAILLVPKVWDAVNDPIFGVILDKVRFRRGRFIPWLRISWLLIPASTVFLFALPDSLPRGAKIAWAIIGYVFWDMSYTMCDAPIFALSTSMSSVVQERTSILAFGRLCATATAVVITLVIEATYISLGWPTLAVILSIASMLLMLPILVVGRERSHARSEKEPTILEMFKYLGQNRYMLVFFISYLLIASTMSVEILIPIFAQYVLGSTAAGTILLGICVLPMVAIAGIVPGLARKVDKSKLYIISLSIYVVTSVGQYFTGYNNQLTLYVTIFLRAIGFGGYNVLLFLFVPDIMEYGHYVTGERQEGMLFSLQTFMTKLTAAIMSSLSLAVLGWLGFASETADPVTGIVDAAAGHGFWIGFTLVSALGSAVALPIFIKFYRLRDRDVELMSRCNNGEISREECESRLSTKY